MCGGNKSEAQVDFPTRRSLLRTGTRIFCATIFALSFQPLSRADSLLVSFTSADGGGGIEAFSLAPQSAGTLFDSENAPVTSLTAANNTAYWVTGGTQVYSDGLTDTTGGAGKTALPSVPFGGVSVTDLAVDPATNSYLVGWNAPGFGWFIAQYPLIPNANFSIFSNDTAPIQGLTVADNKAYWIEGTNLWSENLDGTGKSVLQSFTFGNVALSDLAVDPVSQTYLLAASEPGLPPLLARYPLTPQASGTVFTFANNNIPAVTIAGNRAYWIDGSSVWSEDLNGTGLTLQETLPSQYTLTDLAVSQVVPAAVPEPATWTMLASALIGMVLVTRRHQRSASK